MVKQNAAARMRSARGSLRCQKKKVSMIPPGLGFGTHSVGSERA